MKAPLRLFVTSLALTVLSACASYKNADDVLQQADLSPTPAAFELTTGLTAEQPVGEWWARLQDAQLDRLIVAALAQNRDIHAARAVLQESRALAGHARFDRFPTVEVEATGTRQRQVGNPLLQGADLITETRQDAFDLYWEADLFGRIGNNIRAADARALGSAAELRAAQVSVAAEVASAYISLRGTQYLLDVAEESARNQQETRDLTVRLVEIGQGDQFDVVRAQAQLDLTLAGIPSLRAQQNAALNRLAVLSGQAASAVKTALAETRPLPSVPATLAVGSPLAMLQRRPDIERAEQALAAAVANYNVRVADLYPRLTFTGGLGYLSSDWGAAGGEMEGDFFTFAPSLRWAGFNLGRVKAQITAADARIEGQLALFEQSVMLALEETDNALQNFSREEERRARLMAAAESSSEAAEFARRRFELGSSDFISVLDAERSQLNASAQLAQSETQLLLNLVTVYKALGGGWESEEASGAE